MCIFAFMSGRPDPEVKLQPNNTCYAVKPTVNIPVLHCTADCNPACEFTWRKTGNETILSTNGTLSIGAATKRTAGEYVCTASRNGTWKRSKSLIVLLKDEKGI